MYLVKYQNKRKTIYSQKALALFLAKLNCKFEIIEIF